MNVLPEKYFSRYDFLQFKHEINSKYLQKASVLDSNKVVVAIPNIIISHRKKRQKKKITFIIIDKSEHKNIYFTLQVQFHLKCHLF